MVVADRLTGAPSTSRQQRLGVQPARAELGAVADQLHRHVADPPAGGVAAGAPPRPAARRRRRRPTAGRSVPNTAPRSPRPAADSSASQAAWQTTSPSECPAQPSTFGQNSPAIQHSRPASIGCTSTPMPTRGSPVIGPARGRPAACGQPQVVRRGDLERRLGAGHRARPARPSASTSAGVVGDIGSRPTPRPCGGPRRSTARRKPCGVCTGRSSARSTVPRTRPSLVHPLDGVDHRQHRDHRVGAGPQRGDHRRDDVARRPAAGPRRAPARTPPRRPARPGPGRTDSCRVAPPATTGPARADRRPDRRRRQSTGAAPRARLIDLGMIDEGGNRPVEQSAGRPEVTNALGRPAPSRSPEPAATTTTAHDHRLRQPPVWESVQAGIRRRPRPEPRRARVRPCPRWCPRPAPAR